MRAAGGILLKFPAGLNPGRVCGIIRCDKIRGGSSASQEDTILNEKRQPEAAAPLSGGKLTAFDKGLALCYTALFLVAVTVQTINMSLVLAGVAVVAALAGFSRWRKRLCVPVLGLAAFALMNGLAAVYSPFASSAQEFYKVIAYVSMAVILLALFEGRHVRALLWGFAAVCAVISLLCVDQSSWGVLYRAFLSVAEDVLGADYSGVSDFAWNRVAGIYNDPNVSAAILALGSLVSLHLARTDTIRWRRALACFLVGASAQGFFLSVSRGAVLCFGLSLLVWLAAEREEERIPLFFFMLISAVTTMALSLPAMRAVGKESPLLNGLTLLTGVVIALLDWALTDRVVRKLAGKGKAVGIVLAVLAGVLVVYVIAAFNITGPYTFREGKTIMFRYADLIPGNYTLSGDWDEGEAMGVRVSGQVAEEEGGEPRMATLYQGPLSDASFSVEYAGEVDLVFYGEVGKQLRRLTLSDGTEILTNRPLLPEFFMDRLQHGILGDNSFTQRVQYYRDTWAIFLRSPLWGNGLGATEHLFAAVQPYYYYTLYAHNHLLQVMDESGLLGLAAFLALLGGSGWLLLRRWRKDSLAAALLACWVMINVHSLMELNFSVRAFQCSAMLLLLLPVLAWGEPLSEKHAKRGGPALCVFFCLYLGVFSGLLGLRRMAQRQITTLALDDVDEVMSTLESAVEMDVFYDATYRMDYVTNAVVLPNPYYEDNVQKYVKSLRADGTYYACSGLARNYYMPRGDFVQLFVCSREGIAQRASDIRVWNEQADFYRNEVLYMAGPDHMAEFTEGVQAFQAYLEDFNTDRVEKITLSQENQAFLELVSDGAARGLSGEALYGYLVSGGAAAS